MQGITLSILPKEKPVRYKWPITMLVLLALVIPCAVPAQKKPTPQPPISYTNGKLHYTTDSLGNRVPDFSTCGYKAGEQLIPNVTIRTIVPRQTGDATARIQAAIDHVSRQAPGKDGFRGAVLLQPGTYVIDGSIRFHTSGVVLRGAGFDEGGTTLIANGKDRATLFIIEGVNDKKLSYTQPVTDEYVPVNSKRVRVAMTDSLRVGEMIAITRPSTKEWIDVLGTDHFGGGITSLGWKPGQRDIQWLYTITSIQGNEVDFDSPLTTALDRQYGGGTMSLVNWPGRISNCGIENLRLVSSYDEANIKDEDHRWMAITINNATDCWVRRVTFRHFAGSAVAVLDQASRITIEDCISTQAVSEIAGERRNTFFTSGQQTLFQRCYAENGIHDFTTGFCAPGPNAFVECESIRPFSFSGGLDSWSSGVLFDVVHVDGNAIRFGNRGQDGQGAGWTSANSVLWNCSASRIDCYKPPTAQNWAFGSWSQFAGDGYWGESNNNIQPRSLYYAQLRERTGLQRNDEVMPTETNASSSPTIDQAEALTRLAQSPQATLIEYIIQRASKTPLITSSDAAPIDELIVVSSPQPVKSKALELRNGWLVRSQQVVTGSRIGVPWWSGNARPYAAKNAGGAITRFVPGRTGRGFTDDLDILTDVMRSANIVGISQNYGLWYDRRRDDHEMIRRENGDVWPPFYELPFARSGKDTAWDGLSKYDLTKYNHWYWSRLKRFADLADQKGLLLIHQNYFQHNIIEAGAHYADFPWRTANNINNVGFPEPVPYAGGKRIFMAAQFYDTTHPVRREIHHRFIRQCLSNFRDNSGVIQMIGEEFTGPLHFVQFWLNCIREYQLETGTDPLIGLSTTRDVQDAILNNPFYAALVDVIDIKYWFLQNNGEYYAPEGGKNLAPRQHARLLKPGGTSARHIYKAILGYKQKFPNKAVIYSAEGWDKNGWAVLMAGGSLPNVKLQNSEFASALSSMQPIVADTASADWVMGDNQGSFVIYNEKKSPGTTAIPAGNYYASWINTVTGELRDEKKQVKLTGSALTKPQGNETWALWLRKRK